MKENDWADLGEQIRDTVQKAIDEKDFSKLNQEVADTINRTVQSVSNYINQNNHSNISSIDRKYGYNTERFTTNPAGRVSGPVMATIGFPFGVLMGLIALVCVLGGIAVTSFGAIVTGAVFALLAVGGFSLGMKGISLWKRAKLFREYAKRIGDREYISIKELAELVGKTQKDLRKELDGMLSAHMFTEGHLDRQKTTLILTDEMYRQYLQTLENEKKERQKEREKQKKEKEKTKYSAEVQEVLDTGNAYIAHIHQANEKIPGEAMTEKLSRLETIMKKIFEQVEKDPSEAQEMRKLMNYYLPTTTKLIDAYVEMDHQQIQGENIIATKNEIEATLDTINDAFENLLDRMFRDDAWDISADISVMKTMLAQEGLVNQEGPLRQ